MRISHQTRFTYFIGNMNSSLADLMELNIKASTQKDINRPSDDPVGMARVLGHRSTISDLGQYKDNLNTATGWLGQPTARSPASTKCSRASAPWPSRPPRAP